MVIFSKEDINIVQKLYLASKNEQAGFFVCKNIDGKETPFEFNEATVENGMLLYTLPWTCRHTEKYIDSAFERIMETQASSIICTHTHPNFTSFHSAGDRGFFGSLSELLNHMLYMEKKPSIQLFSLVVGDKEMSLYRYNDQRFAGAKQRSLYKYNSKRFERAEYDVDGIQGRQPGIREVLRTPLKRLEKRMELNAYYRGEKRNAQANSTKGYNAPLK